jgi:DNA replication protein DnaC
MQTITSRIMARATVAEYTPAEKQVRNGCGVCGGMGYVRREVGYGHPEFGRLSPCPKCRQPEIKRAALSKVFDLTNMKSLQEKRFDNFDPVGNASLMGAYRACLAYSKTLDGWLVLAGGYGCGKTHLAAAVANAAAVPSLFVTVPELLDTLRDGYGDNVNGYQERIEQVKNIDLLVMDDLGSETTTGWATEKLFQIVNYRYVSQMPTVITTNKMPDALDGRIASRMSDVRLAKRFGIDAGDYRRRKP